MDGSGAGGTTGIVVGVEALDDNILGGQRPFQIADHAISDPIVGLIESDLLGKSGKAPLAPSD